MKKKFVFWLAKMLKVEIFEKETTEIVQKVCYKNTSILEVKKRIPDHVVKSMQLKGHAHYLRDELAVDLAKLMINEGKVVFEQFMYERNRELNVRMYVELVDQKSEL